MALFQLIARGTEKSVRLLAAIIVTFGILGAAPAQASEAESYVQAIADKLEPLLGNGDLTYENIDAFLAAHIAQQLDMRRIARYVLSKYWSKISAKERQRFMNVFKNSILESYKKHLYNYAKAEIRIVRSVEHPPAGVSVITKVRVPSKTPLSMNWRLYRTENKLRIFDISVAGISKVSAARSEYKTVLEKHGFNHLISEICNRIEGKRPKSC
jgi:phospholipid transport system substrate-binding protein